MDYHFQVIKFHHRLSNHCFYYNLRLFIGVFYIFLRLLGMLGFLFEFKSCRMVAPATVATLRTTEIVVAFVAQILLTSIIPQVIDILGAAFVFFAATALIFEKLIYDIIAKLFSCNRCKTIQVSQDRVRLEEDQNIIPPTSIT